MMEIEKECPAPRAGGHRADIESKADIQDHTPDVAFPQSPRESDDAYRAVVIRLDDRWRLVLCRDGIQWIVQKAKRKGSRLHWEGRKYLRRRDDIPETLTRLGLHLTSDQRATIDALPRLAGGAA